MSNGDAIVRIAARGDGVTAEGRHVAGAVTGDVITGEGVIVRGPHHVDPACRHFGKCGGCQLQHADEEALRQLVTDRVVSAAQGQGVAVGELLETHLSPAYSRRRATLRAVNGGARALIGFREGGSHRVVDLAQCAVLVPELFALIDPLRKLMRTQGKRYAVDIELTLADQGADCTLRHFTMEGLEQTEAVLDFARDHSLARLTVDLGYGAEPVWEPQPVTVMLGNVPVALPPGAFLQATREAEAVMAGDAARWLAGSGRVADLFSGLGTFAFAMGEPTQVVAVEAAREAHLACQAVARRLHRPVDAVHRDLFRNPLRPEELAQFDGVLLDPPRAGAREQVAQLAQAQIQRIVYISCNPASWARDARQLVEAGYHLASLRPVGQFRWSTHVELTSLFMR